MRKGATTTTTALSAIVEIVALRNEKGSYNKIDVRAILALIVALRNEKGSYNKGYDSA